MDLSKGLLIFSFAIFITLLCADPTKSQNEEFPLGSEIDMEKLVKHAAANADSWSTQASIMTDHLKRKGRRHKGKPDFNTKVFTQLNVDGEDFSIPEDNEFEHYRHENFVLDDVDFEINSVEGARTVSKILESKNIKDVCIGSSETYKVNTKFQIGDSECTCNVGGLITCVQNDETEYLTCTGSGEFSEVQGYCKETSICKSYGGTRIGDCVHDGEVYASCCKPAPGRFFPLPIINNLGEDNVRRKRGDPETPTNYSVSVVPELYVNKALYTAASVIGQMVQAQKYLPTVESGYAYHHQMRSYVPDKSGNLQLVARAIYTIFEACKYLISKFYITPAECFRAIENSKGGDWILETFCPAEPVCDPYSPYRTFDGSCNNLKHPLWCRSNSPDLRFLKAVYHDGMWEPRRSKANGYPLPHARDLSAFVYSTRGPESEDFTAMMTEYGQFISHDSAVNLGWQMMNKTGIRCCTLNANNETVRIPKASAHQACLAIDVKPNDPFYKEFKVQCLNFVRSLLMLDTDCKIREASQGTGNSQVLDLSQVYGSDDVKASELRKFTGGLLDYQIIHGSEWMPWEKETLKRRNCSITDACFACGDQRCDEHTWLAIQHVVFLRLHNYIARKLYKINPHWNDEKLFQESRKINIAIYQHFIYTKWLRNILGKDILKRHNMDPDHKGFVYDYNPKISCGLVQEFSASAFRCHTTVFHNVTCLNSLSYDAEGNIDETPDACRHPLREKLLHAEDLLKNKYSLVHYYYGAIQEQMYVVDMFVTPEISGHLFQGNRKFGGDLVAVNIQRGRDNGLAPYYKYVEYCQQRKITKWEDLKCVITNPEILRNLTKHYKDFRDVDLYVGGNAEDHLPGATVGPTLACLWVDQFWRWKVGDRFFYKNGGKPWSFTAAQLNEIENNSELSYIYCLLIYGLEYVYEDTMRVPDKETNRILKCRDLKMKFIDLNLWKDTEVPNTDPEVCVLSSSDGKKKPGTCVPANLCYNQPEFGRNYCTSGYGRSKIGCCVPIKGVLRPFVAPYGPSDKEKQIFKYEEIAICNKTEPIVAPINNAVAALEKAYEYLKGKCTQYFLIFMKYIGDEYTVLADNALQSLIAQQQIATKIAKYGGSSSGPVTPAQIKAAIQKFLGFEWRDGQLCFCPDKPVCDYYYPFRSIEGVCNDYKYEPAAGSVGTAVTAVAGPTSFSDGIFSYSVAKDGNNLPEPRDICVKVIGHQDKPSYNLTQMLPLFTDFIFADVFTEGFFTGTDPLGCCLPNGGFPNPANTITGCNPMRVNPATDPVFQGSHNYIRCMPFLRPVPGPIADCTIRPHSPMNLATAWLDASNIYGSDPDVASRLRSYKGGLLNLEIKNGQGVLLVDKALNAANGYPLEKIGRAPLLAGSQDVNIRPGLAALQTIFAREHNRIAYDLAKLNPHWTDEELFQVTKRIVEYMYQNIVFKEVIPAIFSKDIIKQYDLNLASNYEGTYIYKTRGPVSTEHILILRALVENLFKYGPAPSGTPTVTAPLHPLGLSGPHPPNDPGAIDSYLLAAAYSHSQTFDSNLDKLTTGVWKPYTCNNTYSVVLAYDFCSRQIQYGRVTGVTSYNNMLKSCGYRPAYTFDEFYKFGYIPQDKVNALRSNYLYKSPDDVETSVAVLLETPLPGSILGRVGSCLMISFFRSIRDKDRHFLSNPKNPYKFNEAQLKVIYAQRLSSILCRNTVPPSGSYGSFQKYVLLKESSTNPKVNCNQEKMDLSPWKSDKSPLTMYEPTYTEKDDILYGSIKGRYDVTLHNDWPLMKKIFFKNTFQNRTNAYCRLYPFYGGPGPNPYVYQQLYGQASLRPYPASGGNYQTPVGYNEIRDYEKPPMPNVKYQEPPPGNYRPKVYKNPAQPKYTARRRRDDGEA